MMKNKKNLYKVSTIPLITQILIIMAVVASMIGMQPPKVVHAQTCVTSRISASADDVEERVDNGAVDLDGDTSTHSLQTFRGYAGSTTGTLNWWGMRFLNINVPQGATITSADITFRANATSEATDSGMTLWGQLAANPATFTTSTNNVSSRTKTSATLTWTIPQWTSGSDYETPDLSDIVQEIVDQSEWVENNALVIVGQTTVSQNRSAISQNSTNGSTLAPLLEVCYTEGTAPRIITSGTLSAFSGEPGVPSAEQSYSVSGENLEGNITITPPADFQIKKSGDVDWVSSPNTLVLDDSGGTVASTEILVRFLRSEVGTSSGSILHTSLNATDRNVAVTGTAKMPLGAWVAYNDCAWASGQLETNITKYTVTSGSTTGLLVDYDTGDQTPVTATITSSGSPNVNTGTYGGSETAAGTDAYETFHGIVDMPGVIQYGSSGWYVVATFTGLSPDKTYTFITSANRDGDYTDRFTKFTLQDADAAINTSSAGVTRSTTTITDDTSVFNTGENTANGYVASWAGIVPGADGDFAVRAEANSGTNAYAFSVFMLAEEIVTTDPTIYVTGSLSPFMTQPSVPSTPQTYSVSGVNLTENISIDPPVGFEISTDGSTYASSLGLVPDSGSVPSTTIYVRLNSVNQGNFGGNIVHNSTGAAQKNMAVEGTVSNQVCYTDQEFVSSADTYMSGYNTTNNYGMQTYMRVTLGTSQQRGSLIRWDLSTLPTTAVISNPRLQLNVSTAGSATFNLYNLRRAWVEGTGTGSATGDGATFNSYDGNTSNTWGTPGAANTTSDRYETNLWGAGSSSFSSQGIKTIALNSDGLAVVQGWVDGSVDNYGLTIQNYTTGSTDVQFSTKDNATEANRPRLVLDYCLGDATTYNLAVAIAPVASGMVTLTPSGGTYIEGSTVTLTPVPAEGYQFDSWGGADAGNIIDTGGVYTIVMNADKAITANFSLLPVPHAPDAPTLVQPADAATDISLSPLLRVNVTDPDLDSMDVSFYGREVGTQAPAEEFLIIAIPDTQGLAQSYNTVLQNQFGWIANRYTDPPVDEPDLVFVTHLGDLVNSSSDTTQWQRIDAAFDQFDPINLPYSVGPGNHDIAMGTTSYSTYFGSARFSGKSWYGGDYDGGSDNYNSYSLFSAGGMDFILINLQYQVTSGALDWADALLKTHSDRRAIVEQHDILNTNNSWNNQAAYTALSDNPNLFLMLCGHMHTASDGSAYRLETRTGMEPVHILLTDYQDYSGDDYIRLLTFRPALDEIYAQVFSPDAPGGYLTNATNYEQFTMDYDMEGAAAGPFELIGTANGIASGAEASIAWSGRTANTEYEWYAVASDEGFSTDSAIWSFTTGDGTGNQGPDVSGIPDQTISEGAAFLTINLDDYVTDPDDTDAEMAWTYSGNVELSVNIVSRVATIGVPNPDWNGSETITFRATDPGSLYDEDSALFTVTAVNDAPVITGQAQTLSTPEENPLDILLAHLSVTDVDNDYPDDFSLIVSAGTNYQVSGNTITPDVGFFGELTVPVKVNDGQSDSNTFNLLVTVTQGGVTPVLPSSFWGFLHFAAGDEGAPTAGDTLYAYLNAETTAITSVAIGTDGTNLTYTINVPSYPDGTHPATVTFKLGDRALATAEWHTGTNVQLNMHPPMADAGGPYVSLVSAGSVLLDGTVTDWGDDVDTYHWDLDEDGAFDDSSALNPTFNFTSAGTYPVSLKAVDLQSGEGVDTSQVFAITLSGISGQVYNGSSHPVTVAGVESPFTTKVLYGDPGSETAPTNAGTYDVLVQILSGTEVIASYQTEMVIAKATATVTLGSLSQTYDGADKAATATTNPTGLTVNITYDPATPLNAGSYAVTATVADTNYAGTASGTLVIAKATATVTLGSLSQTYDGTAKAATATTNPTGLTVNITYDPATPLNAGSYAVTATVADTNYAGTASGTLVIAQATATVTLGDLEQQYDGSPKQVSVTTNPSGLTVVVTYDGSTTAPSATGSYAVIATVNETNYTGSAEGTLVISGLSHSIDLVPGWNLVSFNVIPTSTAIEDVLESIDGQYSLVYAWDADVSSSQWIRFDPNVGYGNTLSQLDEAMGFWIFMNVESTLTVIGNEPTSTSISINEGWNLVGYPSEGSDALPGALSDIAGNYNLVVAYHANDTTDQWKIYDPAAPDYANDLKSMAPGWGYWIEATANDTLSVEY